MWDSHTKQNLDKLVQEQWRATSSAMNWHHKTYSVCNEMLTELNWKHLELRWRKNRLKMFLKIVNSLVDINREKLLLPAELQSRDINVLSKYLYFNYK